MKPIVEKVLSSGLIDKSMAEMMVHLRLLPEGSADLVNEDALKDASREILTKLAGDLATEMEKEHAIRETYLDLERLRWPALVSIAEVRPDVTIPTTVTDGEIPAMVDRFGRYFFRLEDIEHTSWLTVGNLIVKKQGSSRTSFTISEVTKLFINECAICWQVSVL